MNISAKMKETILGYLRDEGALDVVSDEWARKAYLTGLSWAGINQSEADELVASGDAKYEDERRERIVLP